MTPIAALQRGLAILRAINAGHHQVREIHAATKLPKSTIARMLETLVAEGYVRQDMQRGYRVTARVLSLSNGFDAADTLLEVARPVLEKLRQNHLWPSDLAILDQDAMVILDTGRDPGTLSLNRTIGSRLPVLVTSLGRACLAFMPTNVIEHTLGLLAKNATPDAEIAKNPDAVRRVLAQARRQGYATGDREYLTTTRSVAVPILAGDQVAASLNMMVVANAMTMDQVVKTCLPAIRAAALSIGRGLTAAGRWKGTP